MSGMMDLFPSFLLLECVLRSVDRNRYQIQIPLPPKIDPTVTMMTVEEKPDVTYSDVGGCKEQIDKLREVVEMPMLHPEKFVQLGIDPPKGVLCYGPPGISNSDGYLRKPQTCCIRHRENTVGTRCCESHGCVFYSRDWL